MIYNFSEPENQRDILKEELKALEKEYHKPQMSEKQLEELKLTMRKAKLENQKTHKKSKIMKVSTTAAAFLGALIILPNTSPLIAHAMEQIPIVGRLIEVVTFREYKYESDKNNADIEIPEIVISEQDAGTKEPNQLQNTVEEVNTEIKKKIDIIVEEFEEQVKKQKGYTDVVVKNEIIATTSDYFTLKLLCYQGSASGYEWNYYYTIDLNTGERLQLKDIFKENVDYMTPINENIKEQMQARMDADEMVSYWLNDEIEDMNFKTITEETHFYINAAENVVIGFDEGDVAPMYMGAVEFEIPAEVLSDIRK